MRIGLIGTDSSHAEQFLQFLNLDQRFGDARIVALAGGEQKRVTALSRYYDVPVTDSTLWKSGEEIDAVIIGHRDGGQHFFHARPFLEAGLPVFIDKPLSLDVDDAEKMCGLAARHGALLTSASALRWQADMDAFRRYCAGRTQGLSLEVTGTFYPASEYGGTFFYGVHAVEMALELVGPDFRNVEVARVGEQLVQVRFVANGADVLLRLVTPEPGASSWFGVAASTGEGAINGQIALPDDYMAPVLDRFMTMIKTGVPPLSRGELLAPVALLTEIDAQLRAL